MSFKWFQTALQHSYRPCIYDAIRNKCFTYYDLLFHSQKISQAIESKLHSSFNSNNEYSHRISILIPPSFEYIACTYAIWSLNCICVPLSTSHPPSEMQFFIENSHSSLLICHHSFHETHAQQLLKMNINLQLLQILDCEPLPNTSEEENRTEIETFVNKTSFASNSPSLIIYTSGTTASPKGVVHTHESILSNVEMLSNAWKWTKNDCILNVLPMNHIHGLVNISLCALFNGGCIVFETFNAQKIWDKYLFSNCSEMDSEIMSNVNIFMAVPTIFSKLIEEHKRRRNERNASEIAKEKNHLCTKYRLMVSGSAALPNSVFDDWLDISGHPLLERYGMTEICMALSNPYQPREDRKINTVGLPLPGVQCLMINKTDDQLEEEQQTIKELLIRTPSMFKEYYNNPQKTAEEFVEIEGVLWFKTGDYVQIESDTGFYQIVGRPVDILKCGGYKISALEIEQKLMQHSLVRECCVFGIEDEMYGESIFALIVLSSDGEYEHYESEICEEMATLVLLEWCKTQLAKYKIPRQIVFVSEIPKNAMGKVNKKQLKVNYSLK